MPRSLIAACCVVVGAVTACADGGVPTFVRAIDFDLSHCAFGQPFTLETQNEWFPLDVGRQWVLDGKEGSTLIRVTITVLDQTETVGGVTTRVVEEEELANGMIVEVSRNYYAEAGDGTVCYFGEDVDIYENGEVVSHEGAWRADETGHFPGVFMPAEPEVGMRFLMEGAPGIAEDQARVVQSNAVRTEAGFFEETIRIRESNPLDRSVGYKVFARGVGLVVDGPASLVSYSGAAGAGH